VCRDRERQGEGRGPVAPNVDANVFGRTQPNSPGANANSTQNPISPTTRSAGPQNRRAMRRRSADSAMIRRRPIAHATASRVPNRRKPAATT
jgi:hypothetical protein